MSLNKSYFIIFLSIENILEPNKPQTSQPTIGAGLNDYKWKMKKGDEVLLFYQEKGFRKLANNRNNSPIHLKLIHFGGAGGED